MSEYFKATRLCDLVMKGGITSGVVYPPAVDEIAQRFYLCGIGGTSAGAIAASLTAAAELRRRKGSADGYKQLQEIPDEINGEGRLLQLFRPDRSTRSLFELMLKLINFKEAGVASKAWTLAKVARLLIADSPLTAFNDNGHGLCTGMALNNRADNGLPPLTEWLSRQIDEIAGLSEADGPLTFGQLRDAPKPAGFEDTMTGVMSIQLQLISTCLTFGRPYALPSLDRRFMFDPDQLSRLLPKYVVEYLVREGEKIVADRTPRADGTQIVQPTGRRLLPLPVGTKLPVILATRMSLSFPALFTLVPLWYPNFHEDPAVYEQVYFCDGGITSNLPVHFFDSPFPRWPTLAINLQYTQTAGQFGRRRVDKASSTWMAEDNNTGRLELFNRFLVAESPLGKVLGLASAIFRSAQVWNDNSLLPLPGYRDRVVEVWLDPHEGGLNLNMPPEVIDGLLKKGRAAGALLAKRFSTAQAGTAMTWENHRWIRFRSSMEALALHLNSWRTSVDHPHPGDPSLWQLLGQGAGYPSYPIDEAQRMEIEAAAKGLSEYITTLQSANGCMRANDAPYRPFCGGPKPRLRLQARAQLSSD